MQDACRLAILAAAVLLFGCGESAIPVSGRVTLDGQPLDEALIMFVPLDPGRKKTGATIKQGAYEVPQLNGVMPGKYRVEIIDNPPLELAHRPQQDLNAALRTRRVIPLRYSQDSPLSFEIGAEAVQDLQQRDFRLDSKPTR